MFIKDIPAAELGKAVFLHADARLIDAASALSAKTDIVVIQDREGVLQGVVKDRFGQANEHLRRFCVPVSCVRRHDHRCHNLQGG